MRRTTVLSAATAAALAAGSLAVTGVLGSSHREAPKILADPTADNTDVYAFTAPDAPKEPDRHRQLDPDARSRPAARTSASSIPGPATTSRSTTPATAVEDVAYRWQFKQRFRNPESFLDAVADRRLRRRPGHQLRPDLRPLQGDLRSQGPVTARRGGSPMTCRSLRPTPGRRRCPTTPSVAAGAIRALPGGGKAFVGPADDPFFLDLNTRLRRAQHRQAGAPEHRPGNQGGGKDDVSGYNTHSFALQVPESEVTRDGRIRRRHEGRQRRRRRLVEHRAAPRSPSRTRQAPRALACVQVSRLGNPLINEVVIPIGQKDKFNRTSPVQRRARTSATYALNPELAAPAERAVQARRSRRRTAPTSSRRS